MLYRMAKIVDPIDLLLHQVVSKGSSDLHLSASHQPLVRIDGELIPLESSAIPSAKALYAWIEGLLNEERFERFEELGDVDFSFEIDGGHRFRGSAYRERGNFTVALRYLRDEIPNFDQIDLPLKPRNWINNQTGLVIVTGPTGSGKSTTIASMVNAAHQSRNLHIVTIEDPIEYVLPPGRGIVRHREIGVDTPTFPRAVRAALREDVDILVIGEMRDQETISAAITVAETGHLVFATLHTSGAAQAVDRIVDAFDAAEQPLVRSRLSSCLIGVIYQRLIRTQPSGRIGAFEVLVSNYGVRNLIREGKTHQIPNLMTTNKADGMQTMEMALKELASKGKISQDQVAQFLQTNQ
jgi:twitching motility protein PilT